jgi:hypothetical protein
VVSRRKAIASDVADLKFRQREACASRYLIAQGKCLVVLNGMLDDYGSCYHVDVLPFCHSCRLLKQM